MNHTIPARRARPRTPPTVPPTIAAVSLCLELGVGAGEVVTAGAGDVELARVVEDNVEDDVEDVVVDKELDEEVVDDDDSDEELDDEVSDEELDDEVSDEELDEEVSDEELDEEVSDEEVVGDEASVVEASVEDEGSDELAAVGYVAIILSPASVPHTIASYVQV